MEITREPDGSITIKLEVGEKATVCGASIGVLLKSSDNMYRRPCNMDDIDACIIRAEQRPESEYPEPD